MRSRRQLQELNRFATLLRSHSSRWSVNLKVPGLEVEEVRALELLGTLLGQSYAGETASLPLSVQQWFRPRRVPTEVAAEFKEVSAALGESFASSIYEHLASRRSRKTLGTFFTPDWLVREMLSRGLRDSNVVRVVDPGAGVGAFTLIAAAADQVTRVEAIDTNVATLGILAWELARRSPASASKVNLIHASYFDWQSADVKRVMPSLYLGNPPYSRHNLVEDRDRRMAQLLSDGWVDNRRANLSTLFLSSTLRSLRGSDSMSFLLPVGWMESDYARLVRDAIWRESRRQVDVFELPPEQRIFPDAFVSSCILSISKKYPDSRPIAFHAGSPATAIGVSRLSAKTRSLGVDTAWSRPRFPHKDVPRLLDFATVRRGTATGANAFFFLTELQVREFELEPGDVRAAIQRVSDLTGPRLDQPTFDELRMLGKPCWLLAMTHDRAVEHRLSQLLNLGRALGADRSHLASQRTNWFQIVDIPVADVLLGPMATARHRAVVNEIGATFSNSIYGISLQQDAPFTPIQLQEWLASDDGQRELASKARVFEGNSRKLEPRDVLNVEVQTLLNQHQIR